MSLAPPFPSREVVTRRVIPASVFESRCLRGRHIYL